jgi:Uma2 family endonuclease
MVRLDAAAPVILDDSQDHSQDNVKLPPTGLDSNEPPLESDLHREQIDLLIRLLKYWWRDRSDFYISGNLTVYFNQAQLKTRDFRGPDIFIVLDTQNKDRRSWVLWEEGGKYPNVVIELLSDSTATIDRGLKKELYQNVWRVPNYFWFHPDTLEFEGFHWVDGHYQPITPNPAGLLWSEPLNLALGIHEQRLRWYDPDGQLIPLPEEQERQAKEQERQAKEQERQAKEQERRAKEQERLAKEKALQRVKQLEEKLRSQGINPEDD